MTEHIFGGIWTGKKLDILNRYLQFYATALKDTPFKLVYIDAFAGTGRCTIKDRGTRRTIAGSANIALDINPPFDELIFIEKKPKHVKELRLLLSGHPSGPRARVVQGTADQELRGVLATQKWKDTRGVLFLDPYGLQCDWETVKQIAATKALDVFFLVSLSGIYRQATNDLRNADRDKLDALNRFLGTTDWQNALYQTQGGLFDGDSHHRHANPDGVTKYVSKRLESIFARVMPPTILYHIDANGRTGAPLYALFFAVSNPAKAAINLASKVSREIMAKLN